MKMKRVNSKRLLVEQPALYNKDRILFIFQNSVYSTILFTATGPFIAGYASFLGASDRYNGIILAIPILTGVIQAFSPNVFERLKIRKNLIAMLYLVYGLLIGTLSFIPAVSKNPAYKLSLLIVIFFLAYSATAFVTPAVSNWIVSIVPINIRGTYLGRLDSFSLAFSTIITMGLGVLLDNYKDRNLEYSGFQLIFLVIVLLSVLNCIFILLIHEEKNEKKSPKVKLKTMLFQPLKDRKFRKILLVFVLWGICYELAIPYYAIYMVTGLNLNYTYIMFMGTLTIATMVVFSRFWGKLADRQSWPHTTKLTAGLMAVSTFLWVFVNKETAFIIIPVLSVFSGISKGGIGLSLFNLPFLFAPKNHTTHYFGFSIALGGLFGFVSALIGSVIIGAIGDNTIVISGLSIGNMQILFGLSGILMAGFAGYVHNYIKLPKQDK